jgi:thiol-disulfide isomerase/thioredoxin
VSQKRFKITSLVILGLVVIFGALKLFVVTPREVTYAARLEQFQTIGVPDFEVPTLDEKTVKLSEFKGSLVLLNFWATWCEPCRAEHASLVALSQRYANNPQLKIIMVSLDEKLGPVKDFLLAGPRPSVKNFTVGLDVSGKLAENYGTRKIPETYIISKDGKLVRKVLDQQNWMAPEFLSFLEALLKDNK